MRQLRLAHFLFLIVMETRKTSACKSQGSVDRVE